MLQQACVQNIFLFQRQLHAPPMEWACSRCSCTKYRLAENGHVICLKCQDNTVATSANEVVSVSPGPSQMLQKSSVKIVRQSSYDKSTVKLKGAAKKSKASKILKNREEFGNSDELIETSELTYNTGVYIQNRVHRSKKASVLKKKIHQAALDLKRVCGYSVRIEIQAPLPSSGPRAEGLSLDFEDVNGDKALITCTENRAQDVSPVKVNRGTMFLKSVEGNYVKKLTPTKLRLSENRRNSGIDLISPTSSSTLSLGQSVVDNEPSSPTLSDRSDCNDSLAMRCPDVTPVLKDTKQLKPFFVTPSSNPKLLKPVANYSSVTGSYNLQKKKTQFTFF